MLSCLPPGREGPLCRFIFPIFFTSHANSTGAERDCNTIFGIKPPMACLSRKRWSVYLHLLRNVGNFGVTCSPYTLYVSVRHFRSAEYFTIKESHTVHQRAS